MLIDRILDRYEAEAEKFVNEYNPVTDIEQAFACKVMVAQYAVYVQEYFFGEDFDFSEIQLINCSGFDLK